jgi:hypothetical protein
MASNTIEEASLALLTAQLDNLTTEIAQLAVGSTLDVALYSFCLPHDTEKLAAAGSPCSRECGAHEVLLLSNNVVGKSRIHLKTFGITGGYD